MHHSSLRLMKDRRYEFLPVDRIVVLNSRDREMERFQENVKSIRDVGLLKPVLVNERFIPETGNYELVCGEGRLVAHRHLGKPQIAAEVIDCDRKEAYLLSLIENIARVPAETMWFARELLRLRDSGMTLEEISRIVGKPEAQIAGYLTLVERGEDRLLRGVEQGAFPITFALQVSKSGEAETQHLLMDAFDQGLISTANLHRIRKIIKDRTHRAGSPRKARSPEPGGKAELYTVEELKRDIVETTREKNAFVRETSRKEGRLFFLVEALKKLRSDEGFMDLLRTEGLAEMPVLQEGSSQSTAEKAEVESHG
jgi:ParB family chromosome partitioning protein